MNWTEITHTIEGIPVASRVMRNSESRQTPATVFLHGWGGNSASFEPLWSALSLRNANFSTLLALDLPGFGKTPPPPTPWDITEYASCVVKYLDAEGIETADLICHSFGGRITTKLLVMHPQRFRKVVYIAPAGILHHEPKISTAGKIAKVVKPIMQLPGLKTLFPAVQRFGYRLIGSHDYLKTSGVMRETFKKVIAEDTAPLLAAITHPVEIFWGRNDGYVPVADGSIMKKTLPHADLTIFEDGKHGIHLTHASQIAEKIDHFLYS